MWHWGTGFVKTRMIFPKFEAPDVFSFLSPNIFVLPIVTRNPAVAHDAVLPHKTAKIELYQVHDEESHLSYPRPIYLATFLLPPIKKDAAIVEFLSQCGPIQRHSSNHPASRPFYFAPEARTFCFYLNFGHSLAGVLMEIQNIMLVRSSTLADLAKFLLPSDQATSNDNPRYIPWERWGPANTRWFEGDFNSDFEFPVYGTRFVHRMPPDEDPTSTQLIRMFDINPYAIGRNVEEELVESEGETDDEGDDMYADEESMIVYRNYTTTSIIEGGLHFVDDVHSSLPYREVAKDVEYDKEFSILVDEESLLLLTKEDVFRVYTM
ncbi:hypothetical protein BOTBODRAFT_58716 [Botryobasidium botryosum FD-172 SS1]|uniref:Uncharacterized protein n=1 Tax=Botryobasidium botryosum (strain FD-172 SS1) TaxID=930990 RepID=A0A067M0W2_BOTB1|nr:hypothetical protein BOTBODRAFT_58716 [Botryobasidium botryosum FD-172 SS1]